MIGSHILTEAISVSRPEKRPTVRAQGFTIAYSGIDHIGLQDQAVTESMGAITDHSHEHLGAGELMIARTRRRALQAARAFASDTPAPGIDTPEFVMAARSGYFEIHESVDWQRAYDDRMRTADRVLKPATAAVESTEGAMGK